MASGIKGNKFTSGEISFDIDRNDCGKSIAGLDTLEVGAWLKLATNNGIQVEPFEKRLLRPPLQGLIQEIWYRDVKGSVPDACAKAQKARLTKYKMQLEELKNVSEFDLVGRKPKPKKEKTPKEPKAPRVANFYRFVKGVDMDKVNEGRGQYKMIAVALAESAARPKIGKALTALEVVAATAAMTEIAKFVKPPAVTNTAFHLNDMQNSGYVEAVNGEGEVQPREPKKEKKAKVPAAAE
jgi:hypothetical protein